MEIAFKSNLLEINVTKYRNILKRHKRQKSIEINKNNNKVLEKERYSIPNHDFLLFLKFLLIVFLINHVPPHFTFSSICCG